MGDYGQAPFESRGGMADGSWHHAVMTIDGAVGVLFIDGREVSRQPWRGTPTKVSGSYPMVFGAYPGSTTFYFKGDLDDVRIYNRALDSLEVQALYAQ